MLPRNPCARRRFLTLCCCVGLLGAVIGCGEGGERLLPVQGKASLADKALPRGYVIFHPDAQKGNTSKDEPRGTIGEDGTYSLKTGNRDGAAPGWYKVTVAAAEQIDPK